MASTPTSQSIKLDTLVDDFSSLPNREGLHPYDVSTWFNNNINDCLEAATGKAGRTLQKNTAGLYFWETENVTTRPQLLMDCTWYYKGSRGIPPNLAELEKVLPSLKIRPNKETNTCYLRAIITLDLDIWKNLVPSVLSYNLYKGLVDDVSKEEQSTVLEETESLLARYYPYVSLDFMKLAADLGYVSKNSEQFVEWFNQNIVHNKVNPSSLPLDF